ncbi:Conserved oligomeric Golgi complex subunit 5 [Grifola frondosa]|uniref:Conserved oligomeric Golgi complex subunit 5 n=1 Tax=Grifola frondosa TaxID=5627 RepID=A0A1C7LST5_GRIFR|nr:Conserved oligomeric Golgi complex subunit 5 [Grifola frondosa]
MSDYATFAHPDFDPNEYANAILAGEPYPPQPGRTKPPKSAGFDAGNEDISVAITKLTSNIDDVEKQLKNVVTSHHEDLLVQAAGVTELQGSLSLVHGGLNELDSSLDKLRLKIRVPYLSLQNHVSKLVRIQQASDILRRTSRFVILTRRLEVQLAEMNKGESADGDNSKSKMDTNASPVIAPPNAEGALTALLDASSISHSSRSDVNGASEIPQDKRVPLSSVKAVAAHLPYIDAARTRITTDMEAMVITGLATLNQSLLASSLQTAHNLRVLPELVQNLVTDLSDAVEGRIRSAFDLTRISKEVLAKEPASASQGLLYKSRVRTEPTSVTAPQWTAALWSSLESLIEEMADCCVKVYTLEKVLRMKRDPVSDVVFLDEAMKVLENKPSSTFWAALGRSLEKQARDAAKNSTFLQQTLSTGYPRLLRLFHAFFAKIAVANRHSVYSVATESRNYPAVGQAFAGGSRSPPGCLGVNIARTVANELDSAKFDPLLVRSVAKYVVSSLELIYPERTLWWLGNVLQ